jgi:hypothetical protein
MPDNTYIRTAHGLITIHHGSPGSGTIVSDFREPKVDGSAFDAALDALESLVLAHACLDVNLINNPNYISGVNTALDAIINNLGDED